MSSPRVNYENTRPKERPLEPVAGTPRDEQVQALIERVDMLLEQRDRARAEVNMLRGEFEELTAKIDSAP